jgi:hypothetical protein
LDVGGEDAMIEMVIQSAQDQVSEELIAKPALRTKK